MFRKPILLRSSNLAKKRRKVIYVKVFAIVLFVVALISLFSYLSHRKEVFIDNIVIRGNAVVTNEQILKVVEEHLTGKYFFLFSKSNILLYPQDQIATSIGSSFAKIEKVDVSFENLTSILISVKERRPDSLWCGDYPSDYVELSDENKYSEEMGSTSPDTLDIVSENINPESSEQGVNKCYFIDDDGFIFTEAPEFTGNVFFRYYGVIDESLSPVGQMFMDGAKYRETVFFLRELTDIGLLPVGLVVSYGSDLELYLEDGTKILFGVGQDLTLVLDNLASALSSDEFNGGDNLKLDYIDLRFGNKVYYKFNET